jgi:2-methylcitrate dehydratase PrpD
MVAMKGAGAVLNEEFTPVPAEGPGRALARVIAEFDIRHIPDDVARNTKLFALDTLGVLAGGARAPGIAELLSAVTRLDPEGGPATVLIDGAKVSAPAAALVNGSAAHALDFDDTHDEGRIHAFSVVLPAALAAAEAEGGASGADLLAALALGAELFCRLGLACPAMLSIGWHPTTGCGALAAAVAAGRILKLNPEQMTNALGLAFVQMSGTTQSILDGAHSKRLGAGFAARNGVTAAYLARAGLTGPSRFLEGKSGLFNLHAQGQVHPEILSNDWGRVWRIRELSMKPYPCCRCTHTLIDLAVRLHDEGIAADDIRDGQLFLSKTNHAIVGTPFDPERAENPVVHAQFSACYTFARALIDGAITIDSFAKGKIFGTDMMLASRLRCEVAPDIGGGEMVPARVQLNMSDGSTREARCDHMKGAPDLPMTEAEVMAKFRDCLRWGLDIHPDAADRAARTALALDQLADARRLAAIFSR